VHLRRASISGIIVGRRSPREVDRTLHAARTLMPSYDHVGSTLRPASGGVPSSTTSIEVPGALASAADALLRWATHDGIRAMVVPHAPPTVGDTVCIVVPFGPFELLAPNRVVAVVAESERVGFAYGTLPGHPEVGEELFLAEQIDPDRLRLTIRTDARLAGRVARASAPLSRRLQRSATNRYLGAWALAINKPPTSRR
jgi:uncharacterized protein (UPF0548 family)